jgi:glycosyltransferase involved in cell wall biosynthesis
MENKDLTAISRIEKEIEKITNKQSNIYFFVLDTKGNPSGSLEYIYKLALILKENDYNVAMLYQEEEEFIGVGEWLGESYASIPHYDIAKDEVSVSPSDILFIPELFSNIMVQTKKLPCKRIALLQNYDYMLEQMPMSAQWGDLGIMEAVCNTDLNADMIKEVFPYIKTTTIKPYIDPMFGSTNEPKKLIINIIAKDQSDINKIIKPFYWKYPMYKWVSFRDLRGFPKEIYSQYLRESCATIWVDDETSFGYSPLEAMQSGSIVMAKTTNITQEWMENADTSTLNDSCLWFDTFHEVHKLIASVVRAWITDNVPNEIFDAAKASLSLYSKEETTKTWLDYIENVLISRKGEMESLITHIKTNNDNE